MRKHLGKLLILAALSVCGAALMFWVAGEHLVSPATASVGDTPAGAEAVSFESGTGVELRGWLFPVQSSRGAVLLMHGVRGNRTNMTRRARLVNDLGYSALSFDFQAHGESEGEQITFGWRESADAISAVDYLRRRYADLPIYVIGVSLGGAAALLAEPPLDVNGMILESVYPDIASAISNRLEMRIPYSSLLTPLFTAQIGPRLGFSADNLAPAEAAQSVSVPVAVLSGTEDLHTTPEDTQRLFNAFPGPSKELVWFEGAAHRDLLAHDAKLYRTAVVWTLTENEETGQLHVD